MKTLMVIATILFSIGCSDDCKSDKAAEKAMWEDKLENDGLSPEQRISITKQFALAMAEYGC